MDSYSEDCVTKLNVKNTFLEYSFHEANLGSRARSLSIPPMLKLGREERLRQASSSSHAAAKLHSPLSISSDSTELLSDSSDSESSLEEKVVQEWRTTVMLRNLPNNYTRSMLLQHIDEKGYGGLYDFFYLPIDFKSQACLGYAFMNLHSPDDACRLMADFDGFANWLIPTRKRCMVGWSNPHQGLQSNIERYKNSPVMHKDVPDAYKPCFFDSHGKRTAFPTATKKVRCPRVRSIPGSEALHSKRQSGPAEHSKRLSGPTEQSKAGNHASRRNGPDHAEPEKRGPVPLSLAAELQNSTSNTSAATQAMSPEHRMWLENLSALCQKK